MIRSILTALVAVAMLAVTAPAEARTEYMPCSTDEVSNDGDGFGRNCVWDATHQGNGLGASYFIADDAEIFRLPHHVAHYLTHGADSPRSEYMPCSGNDTERNCVWDQRHGGTGDGFSWSFFVNRKGQVYRLPHHIAHHLIHGK